MTDRSPNSTPPLTTDDTASRIEAAALIELEDRKKAFPLYYYVPTPKVEAFHNSKSSVRLLAGGNRSGKSQSGVAEASAFALGYRPWVFKQSGIAPPTLPYIRPPDCPASALAFATNGVRVPVPNTGFVVTGQSARKGIAETLWPKFKELLGPFIKDMRVSHAGTPADVLLRNGSRIVFGSDEQKAQAFESTNYTWTFIDEPVRRGTYTGIRRGSIDQSAPIWLTFTPIGPHAPWMFRDLYSKADGKSISVTNISIFDNPYLPPDAVAEWANDPTISEIEQQARLYGRFTFLADRIYANFNPDIHILDAHTPPEDCYTFMVVDPHSIRPWAIAWGYINRRGEIVFYREYPTTDFTRIRRDPKSFEEYAALIQRVEGQRPADYRLIDPNYGPRRDTIRGVHVDSVVAQMAKFGLIFDARLNDDIEFGEGRVRQLLAYDTGRPVSVLNRPKLYVTEDCINLINSLQFYTASLAAGSEDMSHETKREERFKDFADLLRYVAVSNVALAAHQDSYHSPNFGSDDELPIEAAGITGYGE